MNCILSTKKIDKKITKYQKKILSIESKYLYHTIPEIDKNILNIIKKKIQIYKTTLYLLYSNPEFYFELKFVQLDFTRESNELDYLETIWLINHYELMEETKTTSCEIINLIKFALKYNIITFIQFRYLKKTLKKINVIFEYDKCFEKLYNPQINIEQVVSLDDLELFFNMIEIIIAQIDLIKNVNYSKSNELIDLTLISNNSKYTNLIKKIKSKL